MKRKIFFLLSLLLTVLLLFILIYLISGLQHGYSWKKMDWNNDGKTTLVEFFEGSDIGRRNIIVAGKACIEYFSYKDGLAVRVDCPNSEGQFGEQLSSPY